jgi:hypothetical protein
MEREFSWLDALRVGLRTKNHLPIKRKVESTMFIKSWQEVLKQYLEEGC